DAGGPLVVAEPLIVIPGPGIRRAVIDQIELRVVRDPTPYGPAADLPASRRPGLHAEVRPAIRLVERLEVFADQHVLVRPRRVRAPCDLASLDIERGEPSPDAHLAAAVADEHFVLDDERRHRHRLADVDIA